MPNTSVRAAAKGMPNINRRRLLNLTGAGFALAATAMATKPSAAAIASQVAELEAAFHAEWAALRALEPALNAAERHYMDLIKGRRPVMGELTPEEVERLRQTAVADLAKLPPSRASIEHADATRAYKKADAAARRKSGLASSTKHTSRPTTALRTRPMRYSAIQPRRLTTSPPRCGSIASGNMTGRGLRFHHGGYSACGGGRGCRMTVAVPVASDRGLITQADIDRGYDACAIVRVCELAMEIIPGLGQDALVNEAVRDIVGCCGWWER